MINPTRIYLKAEAYLEEALLSHAKETANCMLLYEQTSFTDEVEKLAIIKFLLNCVQDHRRDALIAAEKEAKE